MAGGEPGAGERVGGGLAAGVAGGQPEPEGQGGQVVHLGQWQCSYLLTIVPCYHLDLLLVPACEDGHPGVSVQHHVHHHHPAVLTITAH